MLTNLGQLFRIICGDIVEVVPVLGVMTVGVRLHLFFIQCTLPHEQVPEVTVNTRVRPRPQHLIVGVFLCQVQAQDTVVSKHTHM